MTMTLLLVDDSVVNQKVAARQLMGLGYAQVDLASNGEEAVACWTHKHHDVVIMDCQMPVMDGFEASRVLRSQTQCPHYPVIIALTANAVSGEQEKCLAAGMNDYLTKPLLKEVLAATLSHWQSFIQAHPATPPPVDS